MNKRKQAYLNAIKTAFAVGSVSLMSMAHAVTDTSAMDTAKTDVQTYGTAIIGVVLAIVGFAWIRRVIK